MFRPIRGPRRVARTMKWSNPIATARTVGFRQRVLVTLGTCPTVESGFRKYEARYFASRDGKRRGAVLGCRSQGMGSAREARVAASERTRPAAT